MSTDDPDNMTEKQLREEIEWLRHLIRDGDATASEARRYQILLMNLIQIQEAKRV